MKGFVAVVLGLVLGSCGSSSTNNGTNPQALCKEGSAAVCEKVYTCNEAAALRAFLGADRAACESTLNAEQCATATGCDAGQTYHADMAQACLDAVKAITCAQLTSIEVITPPACNMICT